MAAAGKRRVPVFGGCKERQLMRCVKYIVAALCFGRWPA